ncbi:Eco57I restriction-modification methylase domain-containing protein [Caulobacter sp.]|uniref:Eco57I restriction-modification methylase domain-containing protein n=1 Tax=Caulobacter sp. TaxID=78 RepID=UPI003BB1A594
MFDDSRSFVTRAFLQSSLDIEYRAYDDAADLQLRARLVAWAARMKLKETSAEGAFTQTFFAETWGYGDAGRVDRGAVTIFPKFRVTGEGAGGGSGEADVALGWFGDNPNATPQVLCEYKDIRSALDAKQNRKGSTRSPVEQCLNYVRGARRGMFGNEQVQPWWGLVTDMNEFRLYWWDRAPNQYIRFVIERSDLLTPYDLLSNSEDARFDRFLFWKLFQRDQLISVGGRPPLLRLIERQWVRERQLEGEFYDRYRAVRERLFNVLTVNNPGFSGTPTELLRLSQKLLDRFIFAFYCEDMGARMLFPPQVIRDHLKARSCEDIYDPNGEELWGFCKRLFSLMDKGGPLGAMNVPLINGGLFAADPQIEALALPNHVFAAPGQGANEAALERDPDTLLYLSARYNYAARGDARHSLSLYTLGRIFEQSITELEYRVGELEGRESVAKLSKRERDGVFYTPEWVVNLLVELTLDPWFAEARKASGWTAEAARSMAEAEAYEHRLKALRIVDPACGSGAFLIAAFRRVLDERIMVEREKARLAKRGTALTVDEARLTKEVLSANIHGVDINPASVEIAKLALWLHSARAKSPLSSLDGTILCGNSLVGPDFWNGRTPGVDHRDRINAFDWPSAFPEVFKAGGFDIVLGNPPYVSIQTVRAVDPEVADYLQGHRGDDTYVSAQTGNFDLYLPFFEKGLRMLAPGGRMGYIAPSLWTINQHGEGLRRLVQRGRHLERWVDFKAHQIFADATTYTALQIFRREPVEAPLIAVAPHGDAADIDWSDPGLAVPYEALPDGPEWLMATGAERALIDRLAADCPALGNPKVTKGIIVGIQTSADPIYHLRKVARGRYVCSPKGAAPYEVEIEDAVMKPLVSGPEAKRYQAPETETYLLFPYRTGARGVEIIPAQDMRREFPQAWRYLETWATVLRDREAKTRDGERLAPFDDEHWYRFGRNQNLDKQELAKLIVAQTVPEMRVCADLAGGMYLNNVRVNGILPAPEVEAGFLLGVLNGAVANFVFKRIGKPKRGGYYEANKQFIAPLPVPYASADDQRDVAKAALALQEDWTERRDLIAEAGERLEVLSRARRDEQWLWPDLPDQKTLEKQAPAKLKTHAERREWFKAAFGEALAIKLESLQAALDGADHLEAVFAKGELRLYADGAVVLGRIYLDEAPGRLAESYWRYLLLSRQGTEADKLARELRRPPDEPDTPGARQFMERVSVLVSRVASLAEDEAALNERLFDLYGLDDRERMLVADG